MHLMRTAPVHKWHWWCECEKTSVWHKSGMLYLEMFLMDSTRLCLSCKPPDQKADHETLQVYNRFLLHRSSNSTGSAFIMDLVVVNMHNSSIDISYYQLIQG